MSERMQRVVDKLGAAGSVDKLRSAASRLASRASNHPVYKKLFNQFPKINNSNAQLTLLGKKYTQEQKDEFCFDLSSRIWLSYREGFAALDDEKDTQTDAGWSCMLRAAQMLIAQALMAGRLGRDWTRCDVTPSELRNLIRVFEDCPTAPLGLHNLLATARRLGYEDAVGRWYKASEAFLLIKEAIANTRSLLLLDPIIMIVCVGNQLVLRDIIEASDGWSRQVLIIIPIRLGVSTANPCYIPHLHTLFTLPHFLGFVGGRPRHAVYFIGSVEDQFFSLDPHRCQQHVALDGHESDEHWNTFHSSSITTTNAKQLDPSCALGFSVQSSDQLDQLVQQLSTTGVGQEERQRDAKRAENPLFSITFERPTPKSPSPRRSTVAESGDDEFEVL